MIRRDSLFRMTLIGSLICWICAPLMAVAADTAKRLTMSSIIEGAKKEGKVSWESYLADFEVSEIEPGLSKGIPIYQGRLYAPETAARAVAFRDASGKFCIWRDGYMAGPDRPASEARLPTQFH